MSDHEGHLLGCDGLGCNDEVAFIFTGLGVENYNEFALFCGTLVISCDAPQCRHGTKVATRVKRRYSPIED